MMSDTSARASRLARWFGSFDRNGFSGRRAPLSPIGVDALGVAIGRDGGATREDVAGGTYGGAEGPEDGRLDGAAGDGLKDVAGGAGVNGGAAGGKGGGGGGGGVNSGNPETGDGGVTVAVTGPRSIGSALGRTGTGASTGRGGGGACVCRAATGAAGAAEVRCD